ncbi:MAG: adenylosuccinate lyase, partial [Spirochaetaceae bacterium]|nr:adenylosuccinate lyase [Spirochaetaceae bacterium]
METREIFRNISPLDHRYSLSERAVFEALAPWLSEEAGVKACAKAEIALVAAYLADRGKLTAELQAGLDAAADVDPAEVYKEEEKTKHNIRALVNV